MFLQAHFEFRSQARKNVIEACEHQCLCRCKKAWSTDRLLLHESLEIVQPRFQKFNSKYIESIKIVRAISWVRGTFHTSWLILTAFEGWGFYMAFRVQAQKARGIYWGLVAYSPWKILNL